MLVITNGGMLTTDGGSFQADRSHQHLRHDFDRMRKRLNLSYIDVFNVQYIQPDEDIQAVTEALQEVGRWKDAGDVRYIMCSTHSFNYASKIMAAHEQYKKACGKNLVDRIMLRYNMAHRTAEKEAFPAALTAGVGVLAFTTTRWNTLQSGHEDWREPNKPPCTGRTACTISTNGDIYCVATRTSHR
jgi:aryl-alcohol dehydrogenase-like predicted oxidoreductase